MNRSEHVPSLCHLRFAGFDVVPYKVQVAALLSDHEAESGVCRGGGGGVGGGVPSADTAVRCGCTLRPCSTLASSHPSEPHCTDRALSCTRHTAGVSSA